ncbi:MAG: ribosome biogenesis GTPase Der, partial [Pirellulaceae bacterium]
TRRNKRPKVFYATQIATQPPTIVMKCNNPSAFSPSYRRYLLGALRDQLSFGEVPIKLFLKKREQSEK